MTADFSGFSRWATGNLFDNRNRGIFSEWLVGQALGVIEADDVRTGCGKQPAPQVWLEIRLSHEPGPQLERRRNDGLRHRLGGRDVRLHRLGALDLRVRGLGALLELRGALARLLLGLLALIRGIVLRLQVDHGEAARRRVRLVVNVQGEQDDQQDRLDQQRGDKPDNPSPALAA